MNARALDLSNEECNEKGEEEEEEVEEYDVCVHVKGQDCV